MMTMTMVTMVIMVTMMKMVKMVKMVKKSMRMLVQVQPVRPCLELPGLLNTSSAQRPVLLWVRLGKLPARGALSPTVCNV